MKASRLLCAFACAGFFSACAGPGALQLPANESAVSDNVNSSDNSPIETPATFSVTAVTLSHADSLTLITGETLPLKITVAYTDGSSKETTDGLWFSNDSSIASISQAGLLTAINSGSTTIKVSVGTKSDTLNITVTEKTNDSQTNTEVSHFLEIESLNFATKPLTQVKTESRQILFNTALADEEPNVLTLEQLQKTTDCVPNLKLSNETVAKIENDALVPKAYGIVSVTAQCKGLSDTWTVLITPADGVSQPDETPEIPTPIDYTREEPSDPNQAFLKSDDIFTFTPGDDASYGHDTFPENILGLPSSTKTNIVSFGTSGELIIELNNYILIDDTGPDLIIFENAFIGWTERAQVSVSEDGLTYFAFACDAFDPNGIYAGCAGVTSVNYSDDLALMSDPDTAGGDGFDLADLGLEKVKFIKVTDMATCTNPALCSSGSGGFDFDGLAIANGINE